MVKIFVSYSCFIFCLSVFAGEKASAVVGTGQPALEVTVVGSGVNQRGQGRNMTSEQKLGLRQAEERLYRDYIHRLVKVRRENKLPQFVSVNCCLYVLSVLVTGIYVHNCTFKAASVSS